MIDLVNDQIHAPAFQKFCDFIWSPDPSCPYVNGVIQQYNPKMKIFNRKAPIKQNKGVIYVGICQLIEDALEYIPNHGNYIVIHRTNDRSFTEAMYKKKPESVKHIYTVDCQVNYPDVSAIPIGLATILGEDEIIKEAVKKEVTPASTLVFVRYNVNNSGYTQDRIDSLGVLKYKPFCKVVTHQIPGDEFYHEIKAHRFTMSLRGCGADACRTWSAICLGSIPIVSDCIEMRHFEDLPLVYCPKEFNITKDWLDSIDVSGKSTERMRMSYWSNHISDMKKRHKI